MTDNELSANSKLYIAGAGGHAKEVAWMARETVGDEVKIIHLVTSPEYLGPDINGNTVKLFTSISVNPEDRYLAAVGSTELRRKLSQHCENLSLQPTTIVSSTAVISQHSQLGVGCIVAAGSVITTNVILGKHVHANIGCLISHDVSIGDYSTLSPGVKVSGHVQIGSGVFIGSGATIINGRKNSPVVIGDNSTIAAGACVTMNVPACAMFAGVPAVRKR